jgi:hypothetical protein
MTVHELPSPPPSRTARFRADGARRRDYPLHLIPHGVELLISIDRLGFATNGQLTRLHFANRPNRSEKLRTYSAAERACQIALRRLWDSGAISRVPVLLTSKRTGFGYQHFVNVLTAKGAALVKQHLHVTGHGQLRWTRKTGRISNQTIEHALAINELYVLASRAAELQEVRLHDWLDDRQLTAMRTRGQLRLLSIPDAFLVLEYQGRYCAHFVEIDTGSESVIGRRSPRSWVRTIADYGRYFRESYATEGYFEWFVAPIVLTITSSQTRLEHLLEATKRGGGAGVYWYTTIQQLEATNEDPTTRRITSYDPSVLWQPIWRVVNDPASRSLLDRLAHVPAAGRTR